MPGKEPPPSICHFASLFDIEREIRNGSKGCLGPHTLAHPQRAGFPVDSPKDPEIASFPKMLTPPVLANDDDCLLLSNSVTCFHHLTQGPSAQAAVFVKILSWPSLISIAPG